MSRRSFILRIPPGRYQCRTKIFFPVLFRPRNLFRGLRRRTLVQPAPPSGSPVAAPPVSRGIDNHADGRPARERAVPSPEEIDHDSSLATRLERDDAGIPTRVARPAWPPAMGSGGPGEPGPPLGQPHGLHGQPDDRQWFAVQRGRRRQRRRPALRRLQGQWRHQPGRQPHSVRPGSCSSSKRKSC